MKGRPLIILSLIVLGWSAEGQRNRHGKMEILGRGSVYLGQKRNPWTPLVQFAINFTEIQSISSSFQIRTFDPEGVLFYGDCANGDDWLLLCLRGGQLEIQMGELDVLSRVIGGPKLNDGKWHLLELTNNGKLINLNVDGIMGMNVSLHTEFGVLSGPMRLALGGILISSDRLFEQLQPELDGCVQEGNWLNITHPWETEEEVLWPCYQNIQPGSYFPGTGFAVYNASTFPLETKDSGFKIEMWGNFSQMDGTILNIKAPGQEMMLVLVANNNTEEVILTFGNDKINLGESLKKLTIIFQRDLVEVLRNEDASVFKSLPVTSESQPAYLTTWREGHLAIGGLLGDTAGEGEDYVSSNYLIGCLEKLQIDGVDMDLDLAVKHASVSSHSCPVF
ncbi:sex hormone-binding globulin [Lampris incognitus]|uniref:sex hormone-binding globulin n=1 Tax=Lampris incognitus TaxID=2546036 RepID=UPI0024B5769B|nr:sex hormone-binding globulin [Lampris incognitus]